MKGNSLDKGWETLRFISEQLQSNESPIRRAAKRGIKQAALTLEAGMKEHFEKQDLPWAPLNKEYKKWKEKKGLSGNILIATSTLLNSITHKMVRGDLGAVVGVLRKNGPTGLIGAIMEYGSSKRNIPPRPFIRPTMAEKQGEVERLISEQIKRAIKKLAKKSASS